MNRKKPVFIGGCPRSGTTFLGDLLGGPEQCLVTPESQFKTDVLQTANGEINLVEFKHQIESHWRFKHWALSLERPVQDTKLQSYAEYGDALIDVVIDYAASRGIEEFDYWVDHTPSNLEKACILLRMFPEAKFIHIVRDPRAVVASVMKRDWGPNSVRSAAKWWLQNIAYGLALERSKPERCICVKYEDMVINTESELDKLYTWLGIEGRSEPVAGNFEVPIYTGSQHNLVGAPPDAAQIHKWQDSLAERQVEIIEYYLASLIEMFGYSPMFSNPKKISKAELWKGRLKEGVLYPYNRLRRRWRIISSG